MCVFIRAQIVAIIFISLSKTRGFLDLSYRNLPNYITYVHTKQCVYNVFYILMI